MDLWLDININSKNDQSFVLIIIFTNSYINVICSISKALTYRGRPEHPSFYTIFTPTLSGWFKVFTTAS